MIIALSGKKRSGKDEFYRVAVGFATECFGGSIPVIRYAFADEVKRYAKRYFSHDERNKENTRFILQGIGQMMREEVGREYWIEVVERLIEKNEKKYPNHLGIITDTRYRNEAEWAVARGYPLIRIIRDGIEQTDAHPSETELDDFPFSRIIHNNGSREEYRNVVRRLLGASLEAPRRLLGSLDGA